jgi:hypothetical protein
MGELLLIDPSAEAEVAQQENDAAASSTEALAER